MERMRETDREQDLVQKARDGDDGAFEELVRSHQRRLYAFIYRMSGNTEVTAEVTQSAFVKAYSGIGRFRGEASFRTWLYRIAVNTLRNYMRDEARRRHLSIDNDIPSSEEGAFEILASRQQRELLWEAVQDIPARQREALVLRVQEGYQFKEVAEIMECTIGAAKANYHQAVSRLKRILEEESQ
jgi:RNA polymerase sigma-70 factor (ECF subfamily)